MPKEILRIWKNYLRYYSYLFSIPLLLKTLFAPWRKYSWSYGRGFNIRRWAEAFVSNSFSRIIGAIMRSFLIIIGIIMEIFVLIIGGLVFLLWMLAPIVIVICFILGINYLF
ncbi:MAG: hypothetical protein PHS27_02555 [Candidatus Pacebacteria bacterium]|nr:hypothetical protein [Candidatus Paceibacterota bacterium]